MQDLKVTTKISLYQKGIEEIGEKAHDIKKQRAVSNIVKQAIKNEEQTKLKLVTQLHRLEKRKNQIVIQENSNAQQISHLQKRQERAQSGYLKRSACDASKSQAVSLRNVANMLNKVHSSKIIQTKQRVSLKSAQ